MLAKPIPHAWTTLVVSILESHNPANIEWSFRAEQNWQVFGLEQDAYNLLIKTLNRPQVLGCQVVGMIDRRDGTFTDCWAFLCDHP